MEAATLRRINGTWGAVGSDRHRGYTVTGGAANVAARLSDRAVAGETLVSAEVYEATSHAVACRSYFQDAARAAKLG